MEELALLKKVNIFQDLDEEGLQQISQITGKETYVKDSIIFMEGEEGRGLFFIVSGRVKVSKLAGDGKEHIIHVFDGGDVFGEVMLFDGGPCPATAQALEDTVLGVIHRKDLEDLIRVKPRLALQIMGLLSGRLRMLQGKVRDLALQDTAGRLASYLCRMAREGGVPTPQGVKVDLALNHSDLAALIGTTRETVNRVLQRFKGEGIIEHNRRELVIKDREKLKSYIDV